MNEKRFTGHDVYDGVKEHFQFYDNHKRINNEEVLNLLNEFAEKENHHRENRRELINENNKYRGKLLKLELELTKITRENDALKKFVKDNFSDMMVEKMEKNIGL